MPVLRLLFILVTALAVGALVGLLVGWTFGMPGHWYFWAGGGLVVAAIVVAWFLWDLNRGPNIIASALLACVVAVAMLQPGPARADLVTRNEASGQDLRLMDSQCSHAETLAVLLPPWREKFKNARILSATGVIEWYGCWIREADGTVAVVLSDGATKRFDASAFEQLGI